MHRRAEAALEARKEAEAAAAIQAEKERAEAAEEEERLDNAIKKATAKKKRSVGSGRCRK